MMKLTRPFGRLLGTKVVQSFLKKRIKAQPPGPNEEERARGKSFVWGEVKDDSGNKAVSCVRGPEGYTLTALTALTIIERVLNGHSSVASKRHQRLTRGFNHGDRGVTREDVD